MHSLTFFLHMYCICHFYQLNSIQIQNECVREKYLDEMGPHLFLRVNFQIICGLITHWHTIQPQTSIYFLFSCEREKAQRKIACCHFGFFYFTFKKLYLSTFLPLLKFNLNPLPVWSVQIIQFRGKKGQKTNFPVLHSNWHWNVICQPSSFPVFMKSKKNTIRRI